MDGCMDGGTNTKMSRAIDGTMYMPGIVGLNNIKANDYCNVILQVLLYSICLVVLPYWIKYKIGYLKNVNTLLCTVKSNFFNDMLLHLFSCIIFLIYQI